MSTVGLIIFIPLLYSTNFVISNSLLTWCVLHSTLCFNINCKHLFPKHRIMIYLLNHVPKFSSSFWVAWHILLLSLYYLVYVFGLGCIKYVKEKHKLWVAMLWTTSVGLETRQRFTPFEPDNIFVLFFFYLNKMPDENVASKLMVIWFMFLKIILFKKIKKHNINHIFK